MTNPEPRKAKRTRHAVQLTAQERAKAVLAVWTGWTAGAVCRQLKVSQNQLYQWEKRAMNGMLQALEPRGSSGSEPMLEAKLERLLEVRSRERSTRVTSLDKRLAKIMRQEQDVSNPSSTPPS